MNEETLKVNERLKATIPVAGRLEGDATLKTWDGFGHVLHWAPENA